MTKVIKKFVNQEKEFQSLISYWSSKCVQFVNICVADGFDDKLIENVLSIRVGSPQTNNLIRSKFLSMHICDAINCKKAIHNSKRRIIN
jgi:hypothetical protein